MSNSDEIVDKYDGLGDFVRNASKEDKKAVMTEVAEKAAQDQAQMLENYKWYRKGKKDRDEELLEVVEDMEKDKEYTGFCDETGKKIYSGDWIKFRDSFMGEHLWAGQVTFKDGVWTIDITNPKQIKNSDDWNESFPDRDYISSRSWALTVGYGETGSWNESRSSISNIAGFFDSSDELFKAKDKFNEKYGQYHSNDNLHRPIPVKIVEGEDPKYPRQNKSTGHRQALTDIKNHLTNE